MHKEMFSVVFDFTNTETALQQTISIKYKFIYLYFVRLIGRAFFCRKWWKLWAITWANVTIYHWLHHTSWMCKWDSLICGLPFGKTPRHK